MKRYLLFIFLFISFINLFAQKSETAFFYQAEFIGDSTNLNSKRSELMVLWYGKGYSVYQSYNGFRLDSIINFISEKDNSPNQSNLAEALSLTMSQPKPLFRHMVHKKFQTNLIQVYDNLFFDNYNYSQSLNSINWEIKSDIKIINGFTCQKATANYSGRSYIAWFTEEVPINDGPYVFNGLPGLIVEISDNKNHYSFSLVGIENRSVNLDQLILRNSISMEKSAYYKLRRELMRDVSKALVGKSTEVNQEDLKNVQERYNKANNPLELKLSEK